MEFNHELTSEKLRKKFKSQFDLVDFLIKVTRNRVLKGEMGSGANYQNPVVQVLKEAEKAEDFSSLEKDAHLSLEKANHSSYEMNENKLASV